MSIPDYAEDVPHISAEQMIEVDRAMVEDYNILLIQMMENAGSSLAYLARERLLDGDARDKRVLVLAGTGGNGGGVLVCARRLVNYGAQVGILVTKGDEHFAPIPLHQLGTLRRMGVPIGGSQDVGVAEKPALIIDGLIGYSLKGAPRGAAADLIRWANHQRTSILSLDTPSGVDVTTGIIFDPAIRATATMTLALPKVGLRAPGVESQVGELYLADISVPPSLFAEVIPGIEVGPLFAQSDIIRLW